MEAIISILKDRWGKYSSIPLAIILAVLATICARVKISETKMANAEGWFAFIVASVYILLFSYVIFCIYHNQLPHAKSGSLAVLFILDTEDSKVFDSVRYKLVEEFDDISTNIDSKKLSVICISKSQANKYNLKIKNEAISLLEKTNCVLFIKVRCDVDDVNNAEKYEMRIESGVLHPQFNEQKAQMLGSDFSTLVAPVRNQKFSKHQTMDIFKFTAKSLSYTCQYILGFVYLLSNDANEAYNLLLDVYSQLEKDVDLQKNDLKLREMAKDKLFMSCLTIASIDIGNFEQYADKQYLVAAKNMLIEANSLRPNTYPYFLSMAYIIIILDKDAVNATKYIAACKSLTDSKEWLFSEAFLIAYTSQNPMIIYNKYKQVINQMPANPIKIEAYIEYVLSEEPNRTALHLAAGLLYEATGDEILARAHLTNYMENAKDIPPRLVKIISEKIAKLNCKIPCDKKCASCIDKNE